jgi:hypothetical protein
LRTCIGQSWYLHNPRPITARLEPSTNSTLSLVSFSISKCAPFKQPRSIGAIVSDRVDLPFPHVLVQAWGRDLADWHAQILVGLRSPSRTSMLARWTFGSIWWCRLFNVDGSLSPVDRRTGRYCNESTRLRYMTPLGLDEARRQHRIHECTIAMRTNLVLEALTSRSRTALRYRFLLVNRVCCCTGTLSSWWLRTSLVI